MAIISFNGNKVVTTGGGGMILTNDKSIAERIGPAIAPLLVSNHHLGRLPALAATFMEWAEYGSEHAAAIVANAKSLGQALENRGVPLVGSTLGFTESHTLILMVNQFHHLNLI